MDSQRKDILENTISAYKELDDYTFEVKYKLDLVKNLNKIFFIKEQFPDSPGSAVGFDFSSLRTINGQKIPRFKSPPLVFIQSQYLARIQINQVTNTNLYLSSYDSDNLPTDIYIMLVEN